MPVASPPQRNSIRKRRINVGVSNQSFAAGKKSKTENVIPELPDILLRSLTWYDNSCHFDSMAEAVYLCFLQEARQMLMSDFANENLTPFGKFIVFLHYRLVKIFYQILLKLFATPQFRLYRSQMEH